ncbi:MAG: hypothetical protein ACI4F0_04065 [Agathobacter sp.]
MSACNLPREIVDEGIKIKGLLKSGSHEKEASNIDFFLCQYDYKSVFDKSDLIDAILSVCNVKGYGDLYIPDFSYEEWLGILSSFKNKLSQIKEELIRDIDRIPFETFQFGNKQFLFKRDVFSWVIKPNCFIFLLMENGKCSNDNLVALDDSGKMLWCSLDNITCKNRMGACFVGLYEDNEEENIIAQTYVGVNYVINAVTGKVRERKIVK